MEDVKSISESAEVVYPSIEFVNQSNMIAEEYKQLINLAESDYAGFWSVLGTQNLSWARHFTQVLDESNAPFYKWFSDGQLNVSYNCLDRHLTTKADKIAIIAIADDGKEEQITYQQLYEQVCRFANGLKRLGVQVGDRVVIYMPHSIRAVVAMQACARIGAIHSVVFGGFSAKAIADRIIDATAAYVITADLQYRGGKKIMIKDEIDEALAIPSVSELVKKVVVNQRYTDYKCPLQASRDILWDELIQDETNECKATVLDSEHPLFILYTSGSTGTPKGVLHTCAGYLLGTIVTMKWVFDIKPHDIFWCTADVGWITGHSYVCYGPLAVGATQIIFEGIPTYPDAGAYWRIIEKHKVSIFYTAPTALRALIKIDAHLPKKYDLSSLRLLGSVGEPINPSAWWWYYEVVGNSKCPIVDTWWQTETGSHMLSPLPGITPLKAGSCMLPLPGIIADIVNAEGETVGVEEDGYLVIKKPFPSQLRTIWGNDERYKSGYFKERISGGKYYIAGDSAFKDRDGYFWIVGRIDDILNVSGHRLGTMEIESALVSHPRIAEAAVVGMRHEVKGEAICAFVVCKASEALSDEELTLLKEDLRQWVTMSIGAVAKPDRIHFGDNLPKTRSGKIMRRLLKRIANGEEITEDISTLENPGILEQLSKWF